LEYPKYEHQKYPAWRYHKEKDAILIKNASEDAFLQEEFPGEWSDTPAAHGKITAPSQEQLRESTHGFNFDQMRARRLAEKETEAEKPLAEAKGADELSDKNKKKLGLSDARK
jgi:hypothetical protein